MARGGSSVGVIWCYLRRMTPTEEDVAGRCIVLLRDYHDHEGAWLHCRSPRCSGFGVLEFCGGQIDPVCGGVYSHCPCSLGRFYGLDNLELSGRGFAGYGERAVTAAGEGLTCVDLRGIDAG